MLSIILKYYLCPVNSKQKYFRSHFSGIPLPPFLHNIILCIVKTCKRNRCIFKCFMPAMPSKLVLSGKRNKKTGFSFPPFKWEESLFPLHFNLLLPVQAHQILHLSYPAASRLPCWTAPPYPDHQGVARLSPYPLWPCSGSLLQIRSATLPVLIDNKSFVIMERKGEKAMEAKGKKGNSTKV